MSSVDSNGPHASLHLSGTEDVVFPALWEPEAEAAGAGTEELAASFPSARENRRARSRMACSGVPGSAAAKAGVEARAGGQHKERRDVAGITTH